MTLDELNSTDGPDENQGDDLSNRGLSYGDGLFETIRVVNGDIPLLRLHKERFTRGLKALRIADISRAQLVFDQAVQGARAQLSGTDSGQALIKLIAVRESSGRGYRPSKDANIRCTTQLFALSSLTEEQYTRGASVKLCTHQLPSQASLAGIKHLNRIDQVLSSMELNTEDEGFVFDQSGRLVEGTKSNVFVFKSGQIATPSLNLCGVAGVVRRYILDQQSAMSLKISERAIFADELLQCDAALITNSVMGAWWVSEIDGRRLARCHNQVLIEAHLKENLFYPIPKI